MRRNPFLPEPPEQHKFLGVISHPGFHTSVDFDTAASYALGRVLNWYTLGGDTAVKHYVSDYPVVVALDMSGITPEPDYDAEEFVKPHMEAWLEELRRNITKKSTDDEILDQMRNDMDHFEEDGETQDDVLAYMTNIVTSHHSHPFSLIIDDPRCITWVRKYLATKKIDPEMLRVASGQNRYTKEVSESRIIEVWYLTPAADELSREGEDEEHTEYIERRWKGFQVYFEEDFWNFNFSPEHQSVWSNKTPEQVEMFGYKYKKRIEYHGTTYKRLLQAAPFLKDVLPVPPSPPYRND